MKNNTLNVQYLSGEISVGLSVGQHQLPARLLRLLPVLLLPLDHKVPELRSASRPVLPAAAPAVSDQEDQEDHDGDDGDQRQRGRQPGDLAALQRSHAADKVADLKNRFLVGKSYEITIGLKRPTVFRNPYCAYITVRQLSDSRHAISEAQEKRVNYGSESGFVYFVP